MAPTPEDLVGVFVFLFLFFVFFWSFWCLNLGTS